MRQRPSCCRGPELEGSADLRVGDAGVGFPGSGGHGIGWPDPPERDTAILCEADVDDGRYPVGTS